MLIPRITNLLARWPHFLLICTALICGAGSASAQVTESSEEQERQKEPVCSPSSSSEQACNQQSPAPAPATVPQDAPVEEAPGPKAPMPQTSPRAQTPPVPAEDDSEGKQPKRILWIIPNYRAVGANTYLPPLSLNGKFWLATQDTFDYSNFISVGILSGEAMATKSQPDFRQGAAGYGRYYWHTFADGALENYMVEAIVPTLTKEDPRYYTLGKGGFFKRTGYAASRLFVTRNDAEKNTFNFSEIAGAGAAAGISNSYYTANSNVWVKTYQRWGTQLALDGFFNILKEFWPDIDRSVFHGHYGSRPIH